jgi:quercetin dioxygenase-like cupin family protein
MNTARLGLAAGLFFVAAPALAQTKPAPKSFTAPTLDAAHQIMQAEEMSPKGDTNVFGDPSKPGPYIVRRKLAANQTVRPHYDDQDRWITVLKGTLWVAKGDVYSPDKFLPVREGGVLYMPANTHYFGLAGQNEAVLQITGTGPVKSMHTEVDAKGKPVPENGPYPVISAGRQRRMPVDPDLIDPDQQDQMERAAYAKKQAEAKAKASGATPVPPEKK